MSTKEERDEDLIKRMIARYDRLIKYPKKKYKFWRGYIKAEPCLICHKYSVKMEAGFLGYECEKCPLDNCTSDESYLEFKYVLIDCFKKRFSRLRIRKAAKKRRKWLKKKLMEISDD